MREDQERFLRSLLPYKWETSYNSPYPITHTNPQTGKGAEQERREKKEGTLPDSQTVTREIEFLTFSNYYLFYIGYQMIGGLLHSCLYVSLSLTEEFSKCIICPTPIPAEAADRLRKGQVGSHAGKRATSAHTNR